MVTQFQEELAASHHNIGQLQDQLGQPRQSLASYEKAFAIQQRLACENPTVSKHRSHLATSHHSIGLLHLRTGRPLEAMKWNEQARDLGATGT